MPSNLLPLDDQNENSDPLLIQSSPQPQRTGFQHHANPQIQYYDEYKKLYYTSFRLNQEYLKQVKAQSLLKQKIANIENHLNNIQRKKRLQSFDDQNDQEAYMTQLKASKRSRRTAEQIERKFECSHPYCGRCYGSDGSLQQHLKTKHPELYKCKEEDI